MSVPPRATPPAAIEEITLPAVGCRLAALRAVPEPDVATGDTLLLVPGYTGSKEDFVAILEPLALAGVDAVAIDMRGQFESPVAPEFDLTAASSYAIEALGADLRAAVAWLATTTGGRVHLLGHSFGGLVARQALIAHPALIAHEDVDGASWPASLTLLCSGPAAISGGSASRVGMVVSAIESGMSLADILTHVEAAGELAGTTSDVADFLRRRWLGNQAAGLAEMGRRIIAEPDLCDELARATRERPLPILVACGADDDVWGPEAQRAMAERLGAGFTAIEAAGHSPAVDQPGPTVKVLADFVTQTAGQTSRL